MKKRTGSAVWSGDLQNGKGKVKFSSCEEDYSFKSRFEEGKGTNPEELIAAAHAGCFSMALSKDLSDAGFKPNEIKTTAEVTLEVLNEGPRITHIQLNTEADVPGLSEDKFLKFADGAKKNCPVSQALKSVDIKLNAKLKKVMNTVHA